MQLRTFRRRAIFANTHPMDIPETIAIEKLHGQAKH